MDVIIYPLQGGAPVYLTGSTPEEGVSDGSSAFDFAGEVLQGVRAAGVDVRDYGNEVFGYRFSITRTHATPGRSNLYWLDHPKQVPHLGRVEFVIKELTGDIIARRSIPRAMIKSSPGSFKGCRTTFTYDITGGSIS